MTVSSPAPKHAETADLRMFGALIRDLRHMSARAASDLADWLVHLELEGKADRTLYAYARGIAPLLRSHLGKSVGEFTHTDINDELAMVPVRSRHINRSIYSSFFAWAEWDERIARNPMGRVPRMRHPHRRPKDIFSPEEVALLEAVDPLFTVLFWTGIRRGEAIGLRRDHINLNRAQLIVYQGKGSKDRIIGLPASVLKAVADIDLMEGLRRDEYLWSLWRSPKYQTRRWRMHEIADTTFARIYEQRLKEAGLTRYLNPHQTRHTYAWLMREEGFDLEERQVLMGHESIKTTQHYYGRVTVDDLADKIAEIGL